MRFEQQAAAHVLLQGQFGRIISGRTHAYATRCPVKGHTRHELAIHPYVGGSSHLMAIVVCQERLDGKRHSDPRNRLQAHRG
jgi:hypothetical protein